MSFKALNEHIFGDVVSTVMYFYYDLGEQKLQQEISDKINRDYFFVFQCFNLICKMRIKKIKQKSKNKSISNK